MALMKSSQWISNQTRIFHEHSLAYVTSGTVLPVRNKSLTPIVKSHYQEAFLQKQLLILHILCLSGHQIPKQKKSSQITTCTGLGKKKTLSQQRHWCDKRRISTAQYFTRVGSEMQQNICSLECREEDESFFSAFPRVPFKHFLWHYQKCSSTPSHVSAVWPIPCLRNAMRNTLQPLETCSKTIIKPQFNFTRSLTLATFIKGTMRSAAIYF